MNQDNIGQVYSYAVHPEIRSNYFALCNGVEFSLFRTSSPQEPILYFELADIEQHWELLSNYLSVNSFQVGKDIIYVNKIQYIAAEDDDWYKSRKLLEEIPVRKRAAKRHYGVHGYFTKQTWNVVGAYIKNFTRPNDLVLDTFAGSGVTVIEALMNNRRGINIDINPFANFLVQSLISPVNLDEFAEAFEKVKAEYIKNEPKTKDEITKAIKKYPQPKSLPLPKGSDVDTTDQLFSNEQSAKLALLK
jgi:hypothetical protein